METPTPLQNPHRFSRFTSHRLGLMLNTAKQPSLIKVAVIHLKEKGSSGWCDTTSYEEAIKFANEGNPKLTAKVVAQRENMKIGLTSDTSTLTNELLPSGALPNIPIYLTGEACHMENFNVSEDKPIIRIAFCGAFNCSVKDKTIYSYGAALMNIIDEIESADIATVELTVFLAMSQEGTPTLVTVPVQNGWRGNDLRRYVVLYCFS